MVETFEVLRDGGRGADIEDRAPLGMREDPGALEAERAERVNRLEAEGAKT